MIWQTTRNHRCYLYLNEEVLRIDDHLDHPFILFFFLLKEHGTIFGQMT